MEHVHRKKSALCGDYPKFLLWGVLCSGGFEISRTTLRRWIFEIRNPFAAIRKIEIMNIMNFKNYIKSSFIIVMPKKLIKKKCIHKNIYMYLLKYKCLWLR